MSKNSILIDDKSLLNQIHCGVTVARLYSQSRNLVVEWINREGMRVSGYTADDLNTEGTSLMDSVHQDDIQRLIDVKDGLVSGRTEVPFEMRFINRFGSVNWLMGTASALEPGGIQTDEKGSFIRVQLTYMDINTQKLVEEQLALESTNDALTGLGNRRSYEQCLARFRECDDVMANTVIVAMDINGLKKVNDEIGHAAGDEVIKGAADVIRQAFGSCGECFRVGGDEFMAVIDGEVSSVSELERRLDEAADSWRGMYVQKLSISRGIVSSNEYENTDIDRLVRVADQRMYCYKADYYKRVGSDKDVKNNAYDALCESYAKILKVNLTEDTYQIIKMDWNEKNAAKGYSDRISAWLMNFALMGQVYAEDRARYLKYTNIEYLKSYFASGKRSYSLRYQRRFTYGRRNVVMEILPAREYTDTNQVVFLYVKELHSEA